jgi:hypothetical protein
MIFCLFFTVPSGTEDESGEEVMRNVPVKKFRRVRLTRVVDEQGNVVEWFAEMENAEDESAVVVECVRNEKEMLEESPIVVESVRKEKQKLYESP